MPHRADGEGGASVLRERVIFFPDISNAKKKISKIFQVMGNGGKWPDFFPQ